MRLVGPAGCCPLPLLLLQVVLLVLLLWLILLRNP
jgi:hypothetical protein